MAVMDEFQEEREKIRKAPLSKKWKYFVDYYLVKVVITISAVIILASVLYTMLTNKDTVLYVLMPNYLSNGDLEETIIQPFTDAYVEDPKKQEVLVDATSFIAGSESESNIIKYGYEDEEKVMTLVYSAMIDVMITGQDVFDRYATMEWFSPLTEVLDGKTFAELDEAGVIYYFNDEPIGICVDGMEKITEHFTYEGTEDVDHYLGFIANAPNVENAVRFAEFIR